MNKLNSYQIRTEFLRASYRALFGKCPDMEIIEQLIPESNENGRSKP